MKLVKTKYSFFVAKIREKVVHIQKAQYERICLISRASILVSTCSIAISILTVRQTETET